MKKTTLLITLLSVAAILLMTACDGSGTGSETEKDEWPDTTGYSYLSRASSLSAAKDKIKTVSPDDKFYASGIFNDSYGGSDYCAITSEQNCAIVIDFRKFRFGYLRLMLNDKSLSSADIIPLFADDILIFEAYPNGRFSMGSKQDWMFGFSVEEPCARGHDFTRWKMTSATYPANSTKICTRCDTIPSDASLRATQIGDSGPSDGIIFYIATEGFDFYTGTDETKITAYYLEAAFKDQGTSLRWSTEALFWEDPATISTIAEATAIGTGKRNTALILEGDPTAPAALACKDCNHGGKNDWFLPSKDELKELYEQRSHVGITSGNFWSSSQLNSDRAWALNFNDGKQVYNGAKQSNCNVRAVRAF
jgi:hypothetical protein